MINGQHRTRNKKGEEEQEQEEEQRWEGDSSFTEARGERAFAVGAVNQKRPVSEAKHVELIYV